MADLGDMIAKLMLDASNWVDGLKKAESETDSSTGKMQSAFGGIGATLGAVGEVVAGWKVVDALKEFASEALDVATAVGKLKDSFDILTGSVEASEQIFEKLQGLELKSKFDFAEVLGPAAQRMLELGVSTQQATSTMTALVDAASALRKGPEWINAVTETIAGMQARLVASSRDMKAFEALGIDAWGALAEKIGTDVPNAVEMVNKKMITAQTVTEAVTAEMGKQFAGAAELTGNSWNGAMAILKNSTDNAKEAIGSGLLKILNDFAPVLNTLSGLIQDFAKYWEGLSAPVQTVIVAFTAALPIIATIAAALPLLEAGLTAVAAAFMGPVIPIAALVAALALIGKWVYDEWPAIKAVFLQLWDDIVKTWQTVWGGITQWMDANLGGLATLIGKTWTDLKNIVGGVIDWIVQKFDEFTGKMGGWISSLGQWASSIPGIGKTVDSLTQAWQRGQAVIEANKKATDEHAAAIKANAQATQAAINARREQEAADLAAANATKEAAKAAEDYEKMLTQIAHENKPIKDSNSELAVSIELLKDQFNRLHQEMLTAARAAADLAKNGFDELPAPMEDTQKMFEKLETKLTGFTVKMSEVPTPTKAAEDALNKLGVMTGNVAAANEDAAKNLETWVRAAGNAVPPIAGLVTQAQLLKAEIDKLKASTGDHTAELYKQQSALEANQAAQARMTQTVTGAYRDMGIQTKTQLENMAAASQHNFDLIVESGDASSTQVQEAWVKKTHDAYQVILQEGGTLTEGMKSELDRQEQQLKNHLDQTPSMWKTAYDGAFKAVSGTVDDMIDKLVTGKGSFKEILTGLWQDMAETALHTFLDPLKKAISQFIANEMADLLSGKGFGGLLDNLKQIGQTAADVFKTISSGASQVYQTTSAAGGLSTTIGGAAGDAGGAAGQAGGAAGGATGAAGGIGGALGVIGAIGSAVTAISSVIGNFQTARLETTMNAVEHNTRYTMMYVGERADGGILGVLFKIDEEIAFGYNTKATEEMKDILKDRMNDLLGSVYSIQDAVVNGIAPYQGDIKMALQDIREATIATAQGVKEINVSVQATGLTTRDAAKQLGDQIAAALTRQMAPVTA